ncbi:PAS domain-containing protein [Gluconacetobacter sp. 1c LMG 22058]|uniref:PAS domain-containing protein n=1 Tax=Gluconacetobacter dulcium TaxID=2729096 RepID=A0A7W4K2Y1_9PROT|nr:PAS domain-containing protein [Gluconacetobacter dulcium]
MDAFDFIQLHTGILDSLPVAVIIVDSQTFNIIYVNDGAKKIIEMYRPRFLRQLVEA